MVSIVTDYSQRLLMAYWRSSKLVITPKRENKPGEGLIVYNLHNVLNFLTFCDVICSSRWIKSTTRVFRVETVFCTLLSRIILLKQHKRSFVCVCR